MHEVQPSGYYETGDSLGSAGGTLQGLDTITNIPLASGATGMCYDFSVLGPASIDGIVFVGPNANCTYQSGDTVLAGVTIQLLNSQNQVIASTVTDQHGMYDFTRLVPGNVHRAQSTAGALHGNWCHAGLRSWNRAGSRHHDEHHLGPGVLGMCYDFELKSPVSAYSASIFNIPSLQPMANPPTPVIIIPVIQAFPVTQQFSLYYGGGYAYGNTWHLSVIDAGEPRGTDATAPQISMISMKSDPFAMEGEDVQNAEWVLGNGESEEGVKHFVRFGMRNGIPVTGDFNGDGITDVGFFYAGQWFIDLDDNGQWDQGDLWAKLGHEGDLPVTGDWDGDGKTDIGIFGRPGPATRRPFATSRACPPRKTPRSDRRRTFRRAHDEAALGFRTLKRTSKGDYRADVIDHVFHYGTPATSRSLATGTAPACTRSACSTKAAGCWTATAMASGPRRIMISITEPREIGRSSATSTATASTSWASIATARGTSTRTTTACLTRRTSCSNSAVRATCRSWATGTATASTSRVSITRAWAPRQPPRRPTRRR